MSKFDYGSPEYCDKLDSGRLIAKQEVVREIIANKGKFDPDAIWGDSTGITVEQIHRLTGYKETSISAMVRNLRKEGWGLNVVGKRVNGKYYYRLER